MTMNEQEAPKEPENLILEEGKIYLVLRPSDNDGFGFEVYDRLPQSEDGLFLALLARGLVDTALHDTEDTVQRGINAFKKEHDDQEVDLEIVKETDTDNNAPTKDFPYEIKGNA